MIQNKVNLSDVWTAYHEGKAAVVFFGHMHLPLPPLGEYKLGDSS